jgi:hypothetical protein
MNLILSGMYILGGDDVVSERNKTRSGGDDNSGQVQDVKAYSFVT